MTRARPLALAVVALALAVAAGGCGDENQDFIEDYNSAVEPLEKLNADIGSAASATSAADRRKSARTFDKLARRSGEVNRNLAELDAPSDAAPAFDRLRAALRRGETDLRAFAKALAENDPRKLQRAGTALGKDGPAIRRAEAAVKAKVED